MAATIEERNRILYLVEAGKVSAAQAAQLLDTLALEHEQIYPLVQATRRLVRVRVTGLPGNRQKFNVIIPAGLISLGLRLGTRLVPELSGSALEDLVRAIEDGASGRLLDLQDMEEGERVEIFAE
jgi:hypothetical protein